MSFPISVYFGKYEFLWVPLKSQFYKKQQSVLLI